MVRMVSKCLQMPRQSRSEEPLDCHPVQVHVRGEWETFPLSRRAMGTLNPDPDPEQEEDEDRCRVTEPFICVLDLTPAAVRGVGLYPAERGGAVCKCGLVVRKVDLKS